jgi:ABC-type transport system involved in multi-copper enzyme maturation permease subunit
VRNAWAVALITFREGIKNRVVFGIFIISLLLFGATTLITVLFMRDIVKVAVDLSLSTVSFAGLLTLFFAGVNLFSKDIDKRTIYMVISRPISRPQYLVGKFLGVLLLALTVEILLGLLSSLPVTVSKKYYYYAEARFAWDVYYIAVVYIFLKLAIVSSIITFFASLTSNSFMTLVLALVSYLIGESTEGVRSLLMSGIEVEKVSPLLSALVNAAYYVFPNMSAFDLKTQAAHGLPVSPSYLFWTALYAILYMTAVVAAGALFFRRREFP